MSGYIKKEVSVKIQLQWIGILIFTTFVAGCTTAGPFVDNISSDGRGNLIIEKSRVKMNYFMGTISNEGSTTTTIKVIPEEKMK